MFRRCAMYVFLVGTLILGAGFVSAHLQKLQLAKTVSMQVAPKPLAGPIAYGTVQPNGTVWSSSGNVPCQWRSDIQRYYVTISGVSYSTTGYMTFVTPVGNGGVYLTAIWEDQGALVVCIGANNGDPGVQTGFQFITYKVS
jgi:hypothetical protein